MQTLYLCILRKLVQFPTRKWACTKVTSPSSTRSLGHRRWNKGQVQGGKAMLLSARTGFRPGWYYPHAKYQCKMTASMLSCFGGECDTEGPMMRNHHYRPPYCGSLCCIVPLSEFAMSIVTTTVAYTFYQAEQSHFSQTYHYLTENRCVHLRCVSSE